MRKLTFALLCSLLTAQVFGYDFKDENSGLYFNITSNTEPYIVEVTYQYEWSVDNYQEVTTATIPETVNYNGITYSVTSIGSYAFEYCSGLISVTIPNSVTHIGRWAFDGCSGLTSVTIPNSVTSIDNAVFYYCRGLTSVTIPNSVTSIGSYAFEYCSGLTSVDIPESVTNIKDYAFYGCSGLTSVTIPKSVKNIGESVFAGCSGLASINVENGNEYYCLDNGMLYNANKTRIICCPIGKKGELIIPNTVTSIDACTFQNFTGLTSVTIPESVTSIGSSAFYDCIGLTSVSIPESVTSIGYDAFYNCSGLTSVSIPESVTSIGNYAFQNVKNIVYSGTATYESNDEYWGAMTLNGTIDGDFIYKDAEKTQLSVYIGQGGDVTIPESVTSIGQSAFKGCNGLTSITIPNSVTNIDKNTFQNVKNIFYSGTATYESNDEYWGALTMNGTIDGDFIYKDAEKTQLSVYIGQGGDVTIPESVTSIGQFAFKGCSGLTSITIPNSVTSIGEAVFYGCSGLTSVNIPNSVTSIDDAVFYGCSGLISVTIPNSVTHIGRWAFDDCSGLISVIIPNSVTSIAKSTFLNCSGLTSVDIPESVTSIEDYAFSGCSVLSSVTIPNSVTSIGSYVFDDCDNLTIYCEASSKPDDWKYYWNPDGRPVIWSPSAISYNEATAVSIYATSNTIIVENATADIYVYDTMGRLVARKGVCEGSAQIAMPHEGIYIVKCGEDVKRIYLGFRN